jgi:2-amino-4-hydroxy-6-hydroxymethyldihydropteridine diphosphokinase
MGSNIHGTARLEAARRALSAMFPDIRYGRLLLTEAVGTGYLSPFSNQMAAFSTSLSADEVHACFKQLEHEAGRRPEDKARGIVPLDVDLLVYDGTVLKPEDLQRNYIRQEMKAFLA